MLYFVDESGIDLKRAPCSVLAGVGMVEAKIWPFAQAFQHLKEDILRSAVDPAYEAKGSKLLNRRVFQQARRAPPLSADERCDALESLRVRNELSEDVGFRELLALAQAKLAFTHSVLDLAQRYGAFTRSSPHSSRSLTSSPTYSTGARCSQRGRSPSAPSWAR